MIYAGYKLRRHPKLDNPTVMIVVDRRDLKTQLGDDFENCDYPNVVKALGVRDLKAPDRGRPARDGRDHATMLPADGRPGAVRARQYHPAHRRVPPQPEGRRAPATP